MTQVAPTGEVWFLTGSQHLYGPEVLAQVSEQSQTISSLLAGSDGLSVPVVWQDVLTDSTAIVDVVRARERVRKLRRRDRLDAHVLAGEDVDRRAGRAAEAAAASAHPAQSRAAVVVHRHGLHEPQPGRARRPGVRLHPDPARRRTQDGRGPRLGSRGRAPRRRLGSRRRRPRPPAQPAAGPLRRQHARRRGHRGRQGRRATAVRGVGQHLRGQRSRRGRRRLPTTPWSTPWSTTTCPATGSPTSSPPAGTATSR